MCFIEIRSRRVHLAGVTANPHRASVAQQASNRSITCLLERSRFLIRDRDAKFTTALDTVLAADGARVILTPIQTPLANADAERFVPTIRGERLD